MSFLFYLVWQKDEMKQLNVNLLLLTPVNDPFYQPPLLTFMKVLKGNKKIFFSFSSRKIFEKKIQEKKKHFCEKTSRKIFFDLWSG